MSALIIGGIAFMCGGAIGAAWFVATMQREKAKRKNKRKWYRGAKLKHQLYKPSYNVIERTPPLPDLATLMHHSEPTPSDPDPD